MCIRPHPIVYVLLVALAMWVLIIWASWKLFA